MTVKQLRAFLAVARTLSFAEACDIVHLSQPALSLAIKKLEESLGGRLLTRTTRTVSLTPEGEALLPIAQRLLAAWDNAEEELQKRFGLELGRVALAAVPSFAGTLLPQALKRYRTLYPRINIEVHDVINEAVVEMVQQNRIEMGICFYPGASEEIQFQPLFDDEFIAVLPPDHPDVGLKEITWQRLLENDFIALQRPSSLRLMMEHKLKQVGLEPHVEFDTHQLATVGRMVAAGLGVSSVPGLCWQQMEAQGACCLHLTEPSLSRRVGIVTRRRHQLSTAAEAMVRVLIETFERPMTNG